MWVCMSVGKGDIRRLQTMFLKVAGVDSAIDPILPYLVEVRTTILACNVTVEKKIFKFYLLLYQPAYATMA